MNTDRRNIRNQIKSFFAKHGMKFGLKPDAIKRALHKSLGEDRFEEWCKTTAECRQGVLPPSDEYSLFETAPEINLLFSFQGEATLDVATWIDQQLHTIATQDTSITELGCGSGTLSAWIGGSMPNSKVVGVDALEKFVTAATDEFASTNVHFLQWDYSTPKPKSLEKADVLVSCFGVDFVRDKEPEHVELKGVREGINHEAQKDEARGYFLNWRQAVRDGGRLFVVLRLSNLSHFASVVDAACEAGWTLEIDKSDRIRTGQEQFPALCFVASTCEPLSDSILTSFWHKRDFKALFPKPLKDQLAGTVFQLLAGKQIVKSDEMHFDCGNTMRTSIGTAGPLGFCFSSATTGFQRLELFSLEELPKKEIRFKFGDDYFDPSSPAARSSGPIRR